MSALKTFCHRFVYVIEHCCGSQVLRTECLLQLLFSQFEPKCSIREPGTKRKRKATNQLATNAFSLSVFFFSSTGHFCDPAKVVDEQLSMVTALDIAMTTHFMGQKRQQKRRKYNGINWRGSGWQNTWNAATFFPVWKHMRVTLFKPQTQLGYFAHSRLLNQCEYDSCVRIQFLKYIYCLGKSTSAQESISFSPLTLMKLFWKRSW